MSVKKVVFLGDSHVQGVGVEWPNIYGHLGPLPDGFQQHQWNSKVKLAKGNFQDLRKEFEAYTEKLVIKVEGNQTVEELRDKNSWAALFCKHFNVKYVNGGFDAYNNMEIIHRLTSGFTFRDNIVDDNFQDTLVIYGVSYALKDLTFHQPVGSNALKNTTLLNLGLIISYAKEFVENRGGKFLYFHVDDFPVEFYDRNINPYLDNLYPYLLFNKSFNSYLTRSFEWKRWDGKHFEYTSHKHLSTILIDRFENDDFLRIFS